MSRDPAENLAAGLIATAAAGVRLAPCCLKFALALLVLAALMKWLAT